MNPTESRAAEPAATHDVLNQPPLLTGYNLYLTDPALTAAVRREASWAEPQIQNLGQLLGSEEAQRWGFDANENDPVLHTHDRYGNRLDEVTFHPSWHRLMRTSVENRIHNLPWAERRPGAHVARAVLEMLTAQNELGHICPISMTFSAVAALRADPDLSAEWEPRILSAKYDSRFLPAPEKEGALIGMGMTEKQGGSDVRANTTRAERIGSSRRYLITGHKWFCSGPMCDAFLILAQAPKGLSCFLLPRWTPDGTRNAFHIQRLKKKMGNRSNASSEVEFVSAWAQLAGEEGRGIQTIIEMVHHTRLDCAIAATALMRQALVQTLHHAQHRTVFGKLLIHQPLMRNVLADLALESKAATLMMLRLAHAFDLRATSESERAFARIATAVSKYWLCKRACAHVGEALECLGGNGYVEESIMPRLYREAPLYSIWEGSGNVICLDVLRAIAKEPDSVEAILSELKTSTGANPQLDAFASKTEAALRNVARDDADSESSARRLAEQIAIALQASLLARYAAPAETGAFIASRLTDGSGYTFGVLSAAADKSAILAAAWTDS